MQQFILLAVAEGSSGDVSQFVLEMLGKVGSPALVLLILLLVAAIVYFKNKLAERELQIKELNKTLLESSMSNLEIINELKTSLDKDFNRSGTIETLLRDNNSFLKSIARSLNI